MLRALFRSMLSMLVFLYRRTDGAIGGKMQGLPVLLLTTIGRKTGKTRVTPLGYLEHDGHYVVTASNGGLDKHPGWFHNLTSNPEVTLQIRDRRFAAIAERADPALRRRLWDTFVERAPGYGAYPKRTTREIPVILLRPVSPS